MKTLFVCFLTVATITMLNSFQSNNQATTPSTTAGTTSDYSSNGAVMQYFIKKDSANKMIQSYLTSIESTGAGVDSSIKSFILDADALRAYLSDTSIRGVKVMMAHTLNYINSGQDGQDAKYKTGALTIIVSGFDNAGNYIFGPELKVPNRAMPCPHYCLVTGTASNDLLVE